jgi:hypothetical protein
MYMFCGPFLNISVLIYACIYMDSFGWGKTRKVITEGEDEDLSQPKVPHDHHDAALEEAKALHISPAKPERVVLATARS